VRRWKSMCRSSCRSPRFNRSPGRIRFPAGRRSPRGPRTPGARSARRYIAAAQRPRAARCGGPRASGRPRGPSPQAPRSSTPALSSGPPLDREWNGRELGRQLVDVYLVEPGDRLFDRRPQPIANVTARQPIELGLDRVPTHWPAVEPLVVVLLALEHAPVTHVNPDPGAVLVREAL